MINNAKHENPNLGIFLENVYIFDKSSIETEKKNEFYLFINRLASLLIGNSKKNEIT
jgi:hypothetical protein